MEVCCRTCTDDDRCDEAEGYEYDSWNSQGPWAEVLSVKSEGVVVGDVVLQLSEETLP